MKFPSVVTAVFVVCLSSFASDVDQSAYLPQKTGNEWTMDATLISARGNPLKATARRRTEEAVEKDGKTYLRVRTWMEGIDAKVEHSRLIRIDAEGLHSITEGFEGAKVQTEIKFPMKPGDSWKFSLQGLQLTGTVVGIETVTIGEKTYENCIHIRNTTEKGEFQEDFWEAPHVGCVKSDSTYAEGIKIILTLREFKPGK